MLLHASCVAIHTKAVLILGAPGAGKSDLALRLIDRGAQLVADDQTELKLEAGALIASPPASIEGMIEVRHIGLLKMPFLPKAEVALYVELADRGEKLERLPEDDVVILFDRAVKKLRLRGFEAATPARIRAALAFGPAGR